MLRPVEATVVGEITIDVEDAVAEESALSLSLQLLALPAFRFLAPSALGIVAAAALGIVAAEALLHDRRHGWSGSDIDRVYPPLHPPHHNCTQT